MAGSPQLWASLGPPSARNTKNWIALDPTPFVHQSCNDVTAVKHLWTVRGTAKEITTHPGGVSSLVAMHEEKC